nr:hypothetical protein [Desulforamulus aquiferis]
MKNKIIFELTSIHPCYQIEDCKDCPLVNSDFGCIGDCYLTTEEKILLNSKSGENINMKCDTICRK